MPFYYRRRRAVTGRPSQYAKRTRYNMGRAFSGAGSYRAYRPVYRGRGSLWTSVRSWIPRIGMGLAGGLTGGVPGALAGWGTGSTLSKIAGWGSYRKKAGSRTVAPIPSMHGTSEYFNIKHSEYIGDLNMTIAFTNQSFLLNPANVETFPWLSQIANCFAEYQFNGIVVTVKSICSDAIASGTNLAMGTVIGCVEYDVSRPLCTNKQQMEANQWCVSAKPSETLTIPVECKRSLNVLGGHAYVGTAPTGSDNHFYNPLGYVELATVGSQANYNSACEIWVSYDINFYNPTFYGAEGTSILSSHFIGAGTLDSTATLGNSAWLTAYDNIGITEGRSNASAGKYDTLVFPAGTSGTFLVAWSISGGAAGTGNFSPPVVGVYGLGGAPTANTALINLLQIMSKDTLYSINSYYPATATTDCQFFVLKINPIVTNLVPCVQLGASSVGMTTPYADVFVCQINSGVIT